MNSGIEKLDNKVNLHLPKIKSEEWRKVDLQRIKEVLNLPISQQTSSRKDVIDNNNQPCLENNCLRLVLGNNLDTILSDNLPNGINLISDSDIQKYISSSKKNFNPQNDWSLELNNSTIDKIIGIRISKENQTSLEVIIPEEIGHLKPTRILLIVEKSSKLDLLEIFTGKSNSAHTNFLQVHIDEDAIVNHGLIAIGKGNSSLLSKIVVCQESNSDYSLNFFQEGWHFSRIEPEIIQVTGQAKTTLRGLQVAKENQQLSTFSKITFNGPDGSLDQLQKAIVSNNSHSIFNGIIEVPQIAQKTNANQLSKNLLLSTKGQVDTKPELRIVADDVRCTHGATVSQLEEDELFYLQSRGLSADNATQLILNGYAKDIINQIPLGSERWSSLSDLLEN